MYQNSVVVIGNGESRASINLQKLTGVITLVGCNAVHRDAIVDHLVCVDDRMVKEYLTNINNKSTLIYVRNHASRWFKHHPYIKNFRELPETPEQTTARIDQSRNWGSGPFSLLVASQLPEVETLYLLGFDLYGNGNKINNIYKNTKNYSRSDSYSVDPSYWILQSAKIFKKYSTLKYKIINNENWLMPKEWSLPNVEFLNIEEFKKMFAI